MFFFRFFPFIPDYVSVTMVMRKAAKQCSAHRPKHVNRFRLAARAVNSFAWTMRCRAM